LETLSYQQNTKPDPINANIAEKKEGSGAGGSAGSEKNAAGESNTKPSTGSGTSDLEIKLPLLVILPTAGIMTPALIAEGYYNIFGIGTETLCPLGSGLAFC
jgi:hypothetical protein